MAIDKQMMGLFRAAIAYHQVKQKTLAKELEVPPSQLSEWLNADREMPYKHRVRMLDLLGLETVFKKMRARQ